MKKTSILDTTSNDKEQTSQNVMNLIHKPLITLKLKLLGVNHIE